jgi:hypothetical protein
MRRDPVPLSAKVYLKKAMEGIDTGVKLTDHERLWMLKEAYNHLENAAFAEAENADRLLAACEEAIEMLSQGSPVYSGSLVHETIRDAIAKAKGK